LPYNASVERLARITAALLLAAYLVLLWPWTAGYASGADNSGYLNLARLFSSGKLRQELRPPAAGFATEGFDPWYFTPLGFFPHRSGTQLLPVYPPGLAALQALVGLFVPSLEVASRVVNLLAALLLLCAFYRLARAFGLPRPWALGSTALLACNPLALRFFTWNMSDGPAAALCTLAVLFATKSRKQRLAAVVAGAIFALAVAVRPTNLLLFPALLLALPWELGAWGFFALGAAPLAGALGVYNTVQYGAPWVSGYPPMAREFKLRYFPASLKHYALWFSRFFSPLFLPAWLASLSSACRREKNQLLLAVWAIPFLLFYGFYKYTDDAWWYLRFVLPALPAMLLAAALFAHRLVGRLFSRKPLAVWGASGLFLLALGFSLVWCARLGVKGLARGERVYPEAVALAQERLRPEDVLFASQCSGSVYFYSDRGLVRQDLLRERDLLRLLERIEQEGRQAFLLLLGGETLDFPRRYPFLVEKTAERGPVSLYRILVEKRQLIGQVKPQPVLSGKPSVLPATPREQGER
jgi:hypothetical protein